MASSAMSCWFSVLVNSISCLKRLIKLWILKAPGTFMTQSYIIALPFPGTKLKGHVNRWTIYIHANLENDSALTSRMYLHFVFSFHILTIFSRTFVKLIWLSFLLVILFICSYDNQIVDIFIKRLFVFSLSHLSLLSSFEFSLSLFFLRQSCLKRQKQIF